MKRYFYKIKFEGVAYIGVNKTSCKIEKTFNKLW